jgi:hypothetical protein
MLKMDEEKANRQRKVGLGMCDANRFRKQSGRLAAVALKFHPYENYLLPKCGFEG